MSLAVQALRKSLAANGFAYVPIPTGQKSAPRSGWQAVARSLTAESSDHWPGEGYCNTAILCDAIAFLDVDVEDAQLVSWIEALALSKLGPAPIRYRANSPKRALLYSYADESSSSLVMKDGDATRLQFRGQGKYVVVDGGHPSGVPYQWSYPLKDIKRNMLTAITSQQIRDFVSEVQQKTGWNASRTHVEKPAPAAPERPNGKPMPSCAEQSDFDWLLKKSFGELRLLQDGQARNQYFNNTTLQLAEMCSGWGCDGPMVERTLMMAMDENGSFRDHGAQQIQSTFRSAWMRGSSQPRARKPDLPDIIVSIPDPRVQLITEAPRPLRRAIAAPHPFPVESLGPFAWAAWAIADKIQCPPAIAALSVLGVASLAAQAHADVVLPRTGQTKPLSLFLVSIGESGERKSAADNEASRSVIEYERELQLAFDVENQPYRNAKDAWESERQHILKNKNMTSHLKKTALDSLPEPTAPLTPILTCPEPTYEGLCNLFSTGHGALGLFSDEGGHFVGGHALSEETRLRTAAGLSGLWDGSPVKRVRAAKDGSYVLPGRRLAMHLMMQPRVAMTLLSDPLLKDQGLLSRILISYPQSTAGTRFGKEANPQTQAALQAFHTQLTSLLRAKPMCVSGKRNELTPRHISFDSASHSMWCQFADKVERELAPFGRYEAIKGLANKLPEHAARIAGVMTVFQNFYASTITAEALACGIALAEHFAEEALRLWDAGLTRPEIALAESLLEWLMKRWSEPFVSVRPIIQFGPNAIRDAKIARATLAILEEHGWVSKAPSGTLISGVAAREAWKIHRASV